MIERTAPLAVRLWRMVEAGDDDACWPFTGYRRARGYGSIWVREKGRPVDAHRVAYELEVGPVPEGFEVQHLCNNPSCCNPRHLALGTHAENMAYMTASGRAGRNPYTRGETNGMARLSDAQVTEIRARLERGESQRAVARSYGVTQACISSIHRGLTRRWSTVRP